jgi:hypothetical protein
MADDVDTEEAAPSLQQQTIALGKILKGTAEADPSGTPSEHAGTAFFGWLAQAGPGSREPVYFADVADNYDVALNSNRDLWELFDILENYIEVEDEDPEDAAPPRTFIGLPLIS